MTERDEWERAKVRYLGGAFAGLLLIGWVAVAVRGMRPGGNAAVELAGSMAACAYLAAAILLPAVAGFYAARWGKVSAAVLGLALFVGMVLLGHAIPGLNDRLTALTATP